MKYEKCLSLKGKANEENHQTGCLRNFAFQVSFTPELCFYYGGSYVCLDVQIEGYVIFSYPAILLPIIVAWFGNLLSFDNMMV